MTEEEKKVQQTLPENIKGYYAAIRTLAKLRSSAEFPNSSNSHATIVISTIMDYSKRLVGIFDSDLSGDIADTNNLVQNSIQKMIDDKKILHIVLRRYQNSGGEIYCFLGKLSKDNPENLKIRVMSEKFETGVKNTFGQNVNFTFGDGDAFRAETIIPNKKRGKASCSFNQPKRASEYKKIFDTYFDTCEDYKFQIG